MNLMLGDEHVNIRCMSIFEQYNTSVIFFYQNLKLFEVSIYLVLICSKLYPIAFDFLAKLSVLETNHTQTGLTFQSLAQLLFTNLLFKALCDSASMFLFTSNTDIANKNVT